MEKGPHTGPRWTDPAVVIAAVVLAAFAFFTWYLVTTQVGTEDPRWSRLTYVYGTLEAIVFAATGWLFGREIHRERAERAEAMADDAENRAQGNLEAATSGKALAAQVKSERRRKRAKASTGQSPASEYKGMGTATPTPAGDDDSVERLADVADTLFPDVLGSGS